MLRILLPGEREKVADAKDFKQVWEEIQKFKEENKAKECPDFVGLQDEQGQMLLLTLYNERLWALEILLEDWDSQFGNIDLAGDFDVREAFLTDDELRKVLETFMVKGRISMPKSRSPRKPVRP